MPKVRLNNVTREAALAALFNRAKPQGLGMLQYDKAHVMTEEEARFVLMNGDYVDYLEGRVIKVDFNNPEEIDTTLYDRDNGKDAGEAAVFFARYRHLAQNGATGFLPFKVMGHKAVPLLLPIQSYIYNDVNGGTVIVSDCSANPYSSFEVVIQYAHKDLGKRICTSKITDAQTINSEEGFNHCIKGLLHLAQKYMPKELE